MKTKIKIVCKEHGPFFQSPVAHIHQKQGCPKCAGCARLTTDEFITESKKMHGDKYDYTNVEIQGVDKQVDIICPLHGAFKQLPRNHRKGHGCAKCAQAQSSTNLRKAQNIFINQATKKHDNLYSYPNLEYKNEKTPIVIECPIHGPFAQLALNHLHKGAGCPKCATHGFNPDRPATLYYLLDQETGLYKIGITNRTLNERFGKDFCASVSRQKEHPKDALCSTRAIALMEQSYESGQDAYLAEQGILQAFKAWRCTNDSWPEEKGGRTEFFNIDILELDNNT